MIEEASITKVQLMERMSAIAKATAQARNDFDAVISIYQGLMGVLTVQIDIVSFLKLFGDSELSVHEGEGSSKRDIFYSIVLDGVEYTAVDIKDSEDNKKAAV